MALRTQVFPVSDYDRKHWGLCPVEGVDKHVVENRRFDPVTGENGLPSSNGADGYGTGDLTCRACKVAANTVVVEGVEYNNYPGGRIESRQSTWAGEGLLVMSVTHEGLVIASRERNYHDDSDFYCLVWNPVEKRVEERSVGTTRGGGTDHNTASVDLADEHKADYREWLIAKQVQDLKANDERRWREAAQDAANPTRRGQRVEVTKGRKVPVGTVGEIGWIGEGFRGGTRIGVKTADGQMHFTDSLNVKVLVDVDEDIPLLAEFAKTEAEYVQAATGIVDFNDRGVLRGFIAQTAPAGITHVA